ncbi:MAG: DUF4062 domain-containing protein [Candidatus Angelobacter sp.]
MSRRFNTTENPLVIDRAAAAEVPSPEALREWASDKRVFISSVMSEFATERQAAATAVRTLGSRPVLFEEFGGRDADPEQAYLSEVESSDIFVGILGRRYGKPLKSKFSATHTEFLHAEKNGIRIAMWVLAANDREGHEKAFVNEVRTFYVAPEFSNAANLQQQIEDRLKALAAEDLAPWCKLRDFVFRATEVIDRGSEIEVRARVRNDEVAHGLEQLRPGQWGQGEDGRFTWRGRSREVRVRSLETTTTSARSKLIRLGLEVIQSSQDRMFEMNIAGHGPDELTAIALRSALFEEPNPLAKQNMMFFTEMPDPFKPLREHPVSEEALRPIAELLLTNELVGSGRATRISSFKLGVAIRGRRKCEIEWQSPHRGSKNPTNVVEGYVTL